MISESAEDNNNGVLKAMHIPICLCYVFNTRRGSSTECVRYTNACCRRCSTNLFGFMENLKDLDNIQRQLSNLAGTDAATYSDRSQRDRIR